MKCPFCGVEDTQVKDSRPAEDSAAIRRRRYCVACSSRFTTFERVQLRDITVIKTDGRRVPFDREKLARSIRVALRKRPVEEDRIERLVTGIQRRLETEMEAEVTTRQIGEIVMETLRGVDQVAYVRFASVYRNFNEAKDFQSFLGELGKPGKA
ncbi:MAG: ATP-cone domain protein [Rhodospirillales bacterium]|jgi:transcriptional repressor NrdR|nr:ATP-cone domain protein [Rhodospirillales bacterium]MDB5383862.1 ATP-cone domain protein [Rhodospirillales bacterium]